MPSARRSVWSPALVVAYLVVGAALYANRLFSVLHAESSAVVAFFAFLFSGLHLLSYARYELPGVRLLGAHLAMLAIPWVLLTLSLLWVPNCAYLTGLVLYLVFTIPSVVLALGVGVVVHAFVPRFRRTLYVVIAILIAVIGTVYDLALHPQFYVLNHVYGGVLGPIYEEALYVRPGLFAFRALTILWAVVLLTLSAARGGFQGADALTTRARRALLGMAGLGIGLIYLFAAPLGINTPEWYLQRELGGSLETEHFAIYFDPGSMDDRTLSALADDHEYRHAWLTERLGVAPEERIRSYVYPTVEQKLRLTGAGLTDVSPVWLPHPQIHTRRASYSETFGHELVHAFSREFGLPLIRASFYVGLVEGLAVALEPPDGRPSPREQIAVAVQRAAQADVGVRTGPAEQIVRMLSPSGFWTARGAVSYAAAGSFVGFLLDAYGANRFRAVYARGDFEHVYGKTLRTLSREWEAHIRSIPFVARSADDLVMRRFTVPSLFEVECPHYQPRYVRAYRRAMDRLAVGDSTGADEALRVALAAQPTAPYPLTVWTRLQLAAGEPGEALARLAAVPDTAYTPGLRLLKGDVLALHGDSLGAMRAYEAVLRGLPPDARDARAMVLIRKIAGGAPDVAALFHGGAVASFPVGDDWLLPRQLAAGVGLAARGAYAEALYRLQDASDTGGVNLSVADQRFLQRMIEAWTGVVALRAGEFRTAEASLAAAARAAALVGDYAHVAELRDEITRARWFQRQPLNIASAPINRPRVVEEP